jgi:hypothetical protein
MENKELFDWRVLVGEALDNLLGNDTSQVGANCWKLSFRNQCEFCSEFDDGF